MYIAIDLGGTAIKAGLIDHEGNIISKGSVGTGANRHYSEIIKDMALLSIETAKNGGVDMDDIEWVGIGSPGTVDNKNGILVFAGNINFKNVPMREEMNKYIKKPIYMGNDANCAALGEYKMLKKKMECFVFITLGTGVGGGIIINEKVFTGFNGAGAELGHILINQGGYPCTCGRKGCWEAVASVPALIRMTKEAIKNNPASLMNEICNNDTNEVGGKTAFTAARAGDETALRIVNSWIENVSEGIVDVVNIFQPEVLSIGGAISKEGDFLLEPIKEFVFKNRFSRGVEQTVINIASLGNDAGLIGAAFLGL